MGSVSAGSPQVFRCLVCGGGLKKKGPRGRKPKWCSHQCRHVFRSSLKTSAFACIECGKHSVSRTGTSKYCSVKCASKKRIKGTAVPCVQCGVAVQCPPSRLMKAEKSCETQRVGPGSGKIFCSAKCCKNYVDAHKKCAFTCEWCGSPGVSQGGNEQRKFCSRKCSGEARSTSAANKNLASDLADWAYSWEVQRKRALAANEKAARKKALDRQKEKTARVKTIGNHPKRARKRGLPYDNKLTIAQVWKDDCGFCRQCGIKCLIRYTRFMGSMQVDPRSPALDHIVPLGDSRNTIHGHTKENTQLLCFLCNSKKGASVEDERFYTCESPRALWEELHLLNLKPASQMSKQKKTQNHLRHEHFFKLMDNSA